MRQQKRLNNLEFFLFYRRFILSFCLFVLQLSFTLLSLFLCLKSQHLTDKKWGEREHGFRKMYLYWSLTFMDETISDIFVVIIRKPNFQFQLHYPQQQISTIWISQGATGTIHLLCRRTCCQTVNGSITHHYRASHFGSCKLTAWRIKGKGNDTNTRNETTLLICSTFYKTQALLKML